MGKKKKPTQRISPKPTYSGVCTEKRAARVTLWALVGAVPREAPFSFSEPL